MYAERVLNYYETCSQENIKIALHRLQDLEVLTKLEKKEARTYALSDFFSNNEAKLEELVDHISKVRKASFVKTVSPHDDLRRALLAEFPIIPKL
jgi:predicted transcriptional regulator